MVENVTGSKALPPVVVHQIVAKTDGVPLFIEELTKTVVESVESIGSSESIGSAIPATLQDSLMARLDRLGTAKEVAQLGATIGREFSYGLLQAVSNRDEGSLQQELKQLVEAELVYQRGLPPQAHYLFKHALIQDTAYQSLLKSRRQQLHQQIAQVLEEQFAETKGMQPELLAHHYTEAGFRQQAISYWQQAGQRAVARSANVEAVAHLTKGLELLKTFPDTPERVQQELTLQLALGLPLTMTEGYAAPEVEQTYARARELCQQMGETPQLFPVLFGLWGFYQVRGEFLTARELGEQLLSLAQTIQDSALLLVAHWALGETLLRVGEFVACREHVEQGIVLYNPQQHRDLAFLYGVDPGVGCRDMAAASLWNLGYPDQALKRSQEALTLGHELSHPFSLGHALLFATAVHLFRREGQLAQERAEAVIALAREQEFAWWLAGGIMLRGWALAEQGQTEEGIMQVRQGLAAGQATGAGLERPTLLAALAETHGKAGQVEEGLNLLDEATALMCKTGQRNCEAELYRLKGELTLQQFNVQGSKFKVPSIQHPTPSTQAEAEAEAYFHKAINIARTQQAKSLELRAMMSLSRLWQQQGKRDEARRMLAEIYSWFTEGFDTKDLQEAKALLEELGQ
jgi:predicted ATPase